MMITLFLCCFLGLGALQPGCAAPRSNENNIIERKSDKNLVTTTNSYYLSMNELVSQDSFTNLLNVLNVGSNFVYAPYVVAHQYYNVQSLDIEFVPNGVSSSWAYGSFDYQSGTYIIGQYARFDKAIISRYWVTDYALAYKFSFYYLNNVINDLEFTIFIGYSKDLNFGVSSYFDTTHLLSWPIISGYPDDIFYRAVTESADYQRGFNEGVNSNQNISYQRGYNTGLSEGYNNGRQTGYAEGVTEAQQQTTLASQIFTGFVEVGLLPVNVFLQMFEYEVFGINIAGFVSALITIALVIIIIRVVTGKKDG